MGGGRLGKWGYGEKSLMLEEEAPEEACPMARGLWGCGTRDLSPFLLVLQQDIPD